ncbi:nucleolar complex protein 2 homolog isoform X1 [Saccoglossus kowalevskii]|uniref:Nucleolar complex protein 2 homolog n=1 Tax=Saccoglossus kowalevskii TaxID=10224 RepID=A0ABM0GUC2_SACKO|nr:PREDICTED: nucleolar complex protein 2 homolog [Saccoglossus kowalevskii]
MAASSSEKKRKLAELSVDEFMQYGIDSDSSEIDTISQAVKTKKKKKTKEKTKNEEPVNQIPKLTKVKKHQMQMKSLKEKDPEFYKFLQDEDQELLDFDLSGSDLEDNDDEESEEEDADLHKLPQRLEVASDDSEFESDEESDVAMESSGKRIHPGDFEDG